MIGRVENILGNSLLADDFSNKITDTGKNEEAKNATSDNQDLSVAMWQAIEQNSKPDNKPAKTEKNLNSWTAEPINGSENELISTTSKRDCSFAELKKYNKVAIKDSIKDAIKIGHSFDLWHATTLEVDSGWKLEKINADGSLKLSKRYEMEVQSKKDHNGLIEAKPGVPDSFVKALENKLAQMPQAVLNDLKANGYKIIACKTIPDALPELAKLSPRGWSKDATFYNSDGTHDNVRRLIIAPMFVDTGDELVAVDRENVLTHQIGHAFDFSHGVISNDEKLGFPSCFRADMEKIGEPDHPIVKYFSQPNGPGQQECFAALFGLVLTGPENEADRTFLERNFPNCRDFVRKQITALK